ncbi:MAG: nucleotidyltransferase domain-containing protein [Hahellaceae bacterium]|jgi:predicted nucleotidyltransferase|nr:nucleotidyltransferase domain-containing protein [Hahellaceae bacterium]MCP5211290.1 nucleotidyltransferase domain-containing protein [Hahellaceae bacterium]
MPGNNDKQHEVDRQGDGEGQCSLPTDLCGQIVAEITADIPGVKVIVLFGSFANGSFNNDSDIDLAVLASKKLDNLERWKIAQNLAQSLNRDVDLVDLCNVSTVLRMQIVTAGVQIYGSKADFDLYAATTFTMYQQLQVERKDIVDEFARENFHG